jgi:endoglucanase
MNRGINLGNTLDAPEEGAWAPKAEEWMFDEFQKQGFKTVRVPVCWNKHTATAAPFDVDHTFMARVRYARILRT